MNNLNNLNKAVKNILSSAIFIFVIIIVSIKMLMRVDRYKWHKKTPIFSN